MCLKSSGRFQYRLSCKCCADSWHTRTCSIQIGFQIFATRSGRNRGRRTYSCRELAGHSNLHLRWTVSLCPWELWEACGLNKSHSASKPRNQSQSQVPVPLPLIRVMLEPRGGQELNGLFKLKIPSANHTCKHRSLWKNSQSRNSITSNLPLASWQESTVDNKIQIFVRVLFSSNGSQIPKRLSELWIKSHCLGRCLHGTVSAKPGVGVEWTVYVHTTDVSGKVNTHLQEATVPLGVCSPFLFQPSLEIWSLQVKSEGDGEERWLSG